MASLQESTYHRILRVSSVVCALVLMFESGLLHDSTATWSQNTHQYLANAVGMSASIEPTELNSLTAELTAQKLALQQKESALREREINVGLAESGGKDKTIYILSGVLFILLVLIVLNYTLDYFRWREQKNSNSLKTV